MSSQFCRSHFRQVFNVNYTLFELEQKGMRQPNDEELNELNNLDKIDALVEHCSQQPLRSLFAYFDTFSMFYKIIANIVIKTITEKLLMLSESDSVTNDQARLFYKDFEIYHCTIIDYLMENHFKDLWRAVDLCVELDWMNLNELTYEKMQEILGWDNL